MKTYAILFLQLYVFTSVVQGQSKAIHASAKLQAATIYQNQAEITHTVTATIPQGQQELIIHPISNFAFANTIQISGGKGLAVISIKFERDQPVLAEKGVLKTYNDSLLQLETTKRKLDNTLQILASQREALENSEVVTKGGFNAAETGNFLDFQKQRLTVLFDERFSVFQQMQQVEAKIAQLKSVTQNELAKNTHVFGRVVVQLQANYAAEQTFTVTYLTSHALWTPMYDVRVESFEKPLELVYKAKITQYTGLQLQKIPIKLSSGTPNTYSSLPSLSPWFLYFVPTKPEGYEDDSKYARRKELTGAAATMPRDTKNDDLAIRGITGVQANNIPLYMVDGMELSSANALSIPSDRIKSMDVLKDAAATSLYGARAANGVVLITTKTNLTATVADNANNTELVYSIEDDFTLPSDPNAKYITLKTQTVPANYRYAMWPAKASHAFAMAAVPNWEKLQLLPGDAKIYWQNNLVGNTTLGTTNATDSLAVSLGIDKRVAITKQKQQDYSKTRSLGSNIQQAFTYVISVRNNKTVPHMVTIYDQIPISTGSEIEVANLELSGGTFNGATGMVQWEVALAAGEQKVLQVTYTIKHPKDKAIQW